MRRDGTSTVPVVVNPPEPPEPRTPRAARHPSSAQATGRDGAAKPASEATCVCGHVESAHDGTVSKCKLQSCGCVWFTRERRLDQDALREIAQTPGGGVVERRRAPMAASVVSSPAGLPEDSAGRKACPVFSGVLTYFPDAIAEVARLSKVGNDKHNPGEPLHWSKDKSSDHDDCIIRHQLDVAKGHKFVPDYGSANIRTRAAVAWRALAALQIEIESESKP